MNTPDAGRIRVRWYAIPTPEPGVYTLGDYSSSDWDEDPKSLDPVCGEESTTRQPFTDWRNCCPPPWSDPSVTTCPDATGPQWLIYTAPAVSLSSNVFGATPFAAIQLIQTGPCEWKSATQTVAGVSMHWQLSFIGGGLASLLAVTMIAGPLTRVGRWQSTAPVDPYGPLELPYDSVDPFFTPSPDYVVLKGSGPTRIVAEPCVTLLTEDGKGLITEG